MKASLELDKGYCHVEREAGDKKIYTESAFWVALRKVLRSQGLDVVKRNMEQDGHMMGDKHVYYLRQRAWKWAVYDGDYALRLIHKEYNERGVVRLITETWKEDKNGPATSD